MHAGGMRIRFIPVVAKWRILWKKKRLGTFHRFFWVVVGETGTRSTLKENGSYSPSWQRPSGRLRILIAL